MRTKPQKSIQLTAHTAGVTLKPVVAIVMPAATPCQHTGRQVCRNEDWPPLLGLPHVGLLMIAKQFKTERIPTEYHVSQRHRVEADTVGEPPGKPAVKLQGPAPVLNPSARPQRERSGNQPHQGGRRRPGVTRQLGQRPGRQAGPAGSVRVQRGSPADGVVACVADPDRAPCIPGNKEGTYNRRRARVR